MLSIFLTSGYEGRHPPAGLDDLPWQAGTIQQELADRGVFCGDNYRIVVWIGTGYLEYLSNELKFPHHNSNTPCWLCRGSRAP